METHFKFLFHCVFCNKSHHLDNFSFTIRKTGQISRHHRKFINFFYMKQETSEFEMQMHKYCMGFHSTNFLDCFQNKICHFSIILLKLNEKSFIMVPQKYHVSSVLFIFIYFYSFSTVGVF